MQRLAPHLPPVPLSTAVLPGLLGRGDGTIDPVCRRSDASEAEKMRRSVDAGHPREAIRRRHGIARFAHCPHDRSMQAAIKQTETNWKGMCRRDDGLRTPAWLKEPCRCPTTPRHARPICIS
jgi:hypothetical protein